MRKRKSKKKKSKTKEELIEIRKNMVKRKVEIIEIEPTYITYDKRSSSKGPQKLLE